MRPIQRLIVALGGVLVVATAAAVIFVGGGSEDEPAVAEGGAAEMTDEVEIDDFEFLPANLTVRAGEEITVTNVDTAAHTFSSEEGGLFDTGAIQADGEEGTIEAPDEPGDHPYLCEFHPTMTGTLTVLE